MHAHTHTQEQYIKSPPHTTTIATQYNTTRPCACVHVTKCHLGKGKNPPPVQVAAGGGTAWQAMCAH